MEVISKLFNSSNVPPPWAAFFISFRYLARHGKIVDKSSVYVPLPKRPNAHKPHYFYKNNAKNRFLPEIIIITSINKECFGRSASASVEACLGNENELPRESQTL
jgi:hypothetical protein